MTDSTPSRETKPHVSPLHLASVYECLDPAHADAILAGIEPGFVYRRDGHPNADELAKKCQELHRAEAVTITSSGMGALVAACMASLRAGDHVVASAMLYGKSLVYLQQELARFDIQCSVVDTCDMAATAAAMNSRTKLIVVETISNPRLRVAPIGSLAELAHQHAARLLVDNTFAGPLLCRPLELGADWVLESLTKSMNGHSDAVLGMLAGSAKTMERIAGIVSCWGVASSPLDCWLAQRGLATLALRTECCCSHALRIAQILAEHPQVAEVDYPGLASHPDHALARSLLQGGFGSIVTFTLKGGVEAVRRFLTQAEQIPFCPSLGSHSTTLSHPASTSHRGLTAAQQQALGITPGMIRLSVGIEPLPELLAALERGLQ